MDNEQIAYDYVRKAYDDVIQLRIQSSARIHKLLLVIVVLFTALSYGVGEVLAIRVPLPGYARFAPLLGLIAALLLTVAFVCALFLLRLSLIAVVPTGEINKMVLKPEFHALDQKKVWAALAKNVAQAYDRILTANKAQRLPASALNLALIGGCVFTALFLATAMSLRYSLVEDHSPSAPAKESREMSDAKPEEQDSPPSANPTTPSASQPTSEPSPAEAKPSALEPEDLLESPNVFQGSLEPGERFRKKS